MAAGVQDIEAGQVEAMSWLPSHVLDETILETKNKKVFINLNQPFFSLLYWSISSQLNLFSLSFVYSVSFYTKTAADSVEKFIMCYV